MIKFTSLDHYDNIWLTSDSHYCHKNICRGTTVWDYSKNKDSVRDFDTLDEMNDAIIKGVSCVGENDALIHCGDVAFSDKTNISKYCAACKGDIYLTIGNHDHNIIKYDYIQKDFKLIRDIQYLRFNHTKIVVCHYPMLVWHQSHKGARLAYGHVHGSNPGVGKSQDVGIDVAFRLFGEYRPFSFKEFVDLTDRKNTYLESHHTKNTN